MQDPRLKQPHCLAHLCVAGPAPAFLLSAVIRGGKTFENGKMGYAGCIRALLPLMCSQRALASMFCHRFTIKAEIFPSLEDEEAWYYLPLWRGSGSRRKGDDDGELGNIGYDAQNKALEAAFRELGIFINKVTHAFRMLAARVMDEDGIDDSVCGCQACRHIFMSFV